jgi:hypothetical protein
VRSTAFIEVCCELVALSRLLALFAFADGHTSTLRSPGVSFGVSFVLRYAEHFILTQTLVARWRIVANSKVTFVLEGRETTNFARELQNI